MKQTIFIILMFNLNFVFKAQNSINDYQKNFEHSRDSLTKIGEFYSLSDAEKVHPDSVRVLYLGNTRLKKFPTKILNFKNLVFLSFINFDIKELYSNTPWLLTDIEKSKYIKRLVSHPSLKHDRGGWFCKPRKTKIKRIPNEITQLKNLSSIHLNHHQLSKRKIKKLKNIIPTCEIIIG